MQREDTQRHTTSLEDALYRLRGCPLFYAERVKNSRGNRASLRCQDYEEGRTVPMWISWKHLDSDFPNLLTYEEKVDVFCEQTLGWQLQIANLITNGGTTFPQANTGEPGYEVIAIRHSGFAVLHICMSYFELVGSLVSPTNKRFQQGVRDVLPALFTGKPEDDNALSDFLYEGARNGLYHTGRTGPRVGLDQPADGSPIAFDPKHKTLVVNPHRLPVVLIEHLEKLKIRLLDPVEVGLHERFEKRFDRGFSK